jgi:hypothetical protein
LPDWVCRHDDSGDNNENGASIGVVGSGAKDGSGNDDDEMANLSAVMKKLNGLIQTGNDRLGSEKRTRRRKTVVRRFICDRRQRQRRLMETQSSRGNDDSDNTNRYISGEGNDFDNDDSASITIQQQQQQQQHNMSPLEWHTALLAYWQLCNQLRVRHPTWRDDIYLNHNRRQRKNMNSSSDSINDDDDDDDGGVAAAITPSQIDELQIMLRYATWAYEPDDENLRSYLQGGCGNRIVDEEKRRWMVMQDYGSSDISNDNGGLELLVHRTTDFVIDDDNVNDDNDADDSAKVTTTTTTKKSIHNSKKQRRQRKPPG